MRGNACGKVVIGVLASCSLLVGCGPAGVAVTVPAAGSLTAAGVPIAGVNVTFTPVDGRSATATTDAEGRFTLSTFASRDGAVPGRHRVTLSVSTADVPMPGTPEAVGYKPQPAPFAKKYGGLDSTDLEVDIPAAGDRAIVLDVESR